MCRHRTAPDGPRTCPSHACRQWAAAIDETRSLRAREAAIIALLADVTPSVDASGTALSATQEAVLERSGVISRAPGAESDYPIIAQRRGDLGSWGFTAAQCEHSGHCPIVPCIATSRGFESARKEFLTQLSEGERAALQTYSTSSYIAINDVFTGRNQYPSEMTRQTVIDLSTAFERYRQLPDRETAIVMRGTGVPGDWMMPADSYVHTPFAVGARIQFTQVTSCTTNPDEALHWSDLGMYDSRSGPLIMVIKTRDALPISEVSTCASEQEVVVGPGAQFRCVRADVSGVDDTPTVYLVAEDLVAAEQKAVDTAATANA